MEEENEDIFLDNKNSQQYTNKTPRQAPLIELFHLCFLQKREHTYARSVIIQLGVGSETAGSPLGFLC